MSFDFIYNALDVAMGKVEYFFAAYLVILAVFIIKGTKKERYAFLYPVLVLTLTVFNPFLMTESVLHLTGMDERVRRFYWLLPVNILLAYGIVKLMARFRAKAWKALVAVLACLFIVTAGSFMGQTLQKTQNVYKTNPEIMEMDRELHALAGDRDIRVGMYDPAIMQMREYDGSICGTISRYYCIYWTIDITDQQAVKDQIGGTGEGLIVTAVRFHYRYKEEDFRKALADTRTEYLAFVRSDTEAQDYLQSVGCKKCGEFPTYVLYDTGFHPDDGWSGNYYTVDHPAEGTVVNLIRHSETEGNVQSLVMGRDFDSPLTEGGRSTTAEFGDLLKEEVPEIDAAYSSPSGRAMDTTRIVLDSMGDEDMEIKRENGLQDIWWGGAEGMTRPEAEARYGSLEGDSFFGSADDPDYQSPGGGENLFQYLTRVDGAMNEIAGENDGKQVLVCTHSAISYWLQETFDQPDYGGIYHYSVTRMLYLDGTWYMLDFNHILV